MISTANSLDQFIDRKQTIDNSSGIRFKDFGSSLKALNRVKVMTADHTARGPSSGLKSRVTQPIKEDDLSDIAPKF